MFSLTLDSALSTFLPVTAPSEGRVPPFVESAREIMLSFFRRLMKNNQGATVVEYTLIASLIAVAAIASMRSVGTKVSSVLGAVGPAIN